MATVDFYKSLDYDFSIYEGENDLKGLTTAGFKGDDPLTIDDFDKLELNATRDVVSCYLRPITAINTTHSSYGLKHLVERVLAKETKGEINYVRNGVLILAMYDAGFRIKRISSSFNCFFNVSEKSVKLLHQASLIV